MLHDPFLIPPCVAFWPRAARAVLEAFPRDWQKLRIVVPTYLHAQLMKKALAQEVQGAFVSPRIQTLAGWLGIHAAPASAIVSPSQRLMGLYAELRQHAWLKSLFSAEQNADLMPLAQLLLTLCDELTEALLPTIKLSPSAAQQRWQTALEQLSPPARSLLSNESQLVWTVWQSQLGGNALGEDPVAARYARMLLLAEQACEPMVWIDAVAPGAMERTFLAAYAQRQAVMPILVDWRSASLAPAFSLAWPEVVEPSMPPDPEDALNRMAEGLKDAPMPPMFRSAGLDALPVSDALIHTPEGVSLRMASSLEDEALQGAQTIIDWLQTGKTCIAVIAQDRLTARRIRALLERARIAVCDETGWKLSTTRAAASLSAWFEVVATRAETVALLDLLKSPFIAPGRSPKDQLVMRIEALLRRQNVLGGWQAIEAALQDAPAERRWVRRLARQAESFSARRSLPNWIRATHAALGAIGVAPALAEDPAGMQIMRLLTGLEEECADSAPVFSFAEWRSFLGLQMEATTFVPLDSDRRVVMLPLNGARLRNFDAVLMVGCDADHLPAKAPETLFFANAVRRELGLATRESSQRLQLRDFTEMLCSNGEIVLSWQTQRNGEPNPPSPWVERLRLLLDKSRVQQPQVQPLPESSVRIEPRSLLPQPVTKPSPSAPHLLPGRLSASAFNTFIACPYQFFVTRMLRLNGLDELSDMPEKRDYGGWLHEILKTFHDALRDGTVGREQHARECLLREISDAVFNKEVQRNAAALAYYARWQKVIPAYLEWAAEREAQGWRFVMGEQALERTLTLAQGEIVLHGRVDRIDENAAGERAVLDYKTQNQAALLGKIKLGEDHQLPFYGLLAAEPVDGAHFVALEVTRDKQRNRTGAVEAPDFPQWRDALERHIVQCMSAIKTGAALTPNGIEAVCQYCEVRGICRKGSWL